MSTEIEHVYVNFSNRLCFCLPAKPIAEERARHYADRTPGLDSDDWFEVYTAEVAYALCSLPALEDWAFSHMNWNDFENDAVRVPRPELAFDLNEEWGNGTARLSLAVWVYNDR